MAHRLPRPHAASCGRRVWGGLPCFVSLFSSVRSLGLALLCSAAAAGPLPHAVPSRWSLNGYFVVSPAGGHAWRPGFVVAGPMPAVPLPGGAAPAHLVSPRLFTTSAVFEKTRLVSL